MRIEEVCPFTRKACSCCDGTSNWSPKSKVLHPCMYWENDSYDEEHCRIRRAVNIILAPYDKKKDRHYNRSVDVPF